MRETVIRKGWLFVLFWAMVMALGSVWAQEAGGPDNKFRAKNIKTLESLTGVIKKNEEKLAGARVALKGAATAEETAEITKEINQLRERLGGLREELAKLATGVGEAEYEAIGEQISSLSEELEEMGRLVVGEFNDATSSARETEKMRTKLGTLSQRESMSRTALSRLKEFDGAKVEESLKLELEKMREEWDGRLAQVVSQREALALRIERRESESIPVMERLWGAIGSFFTQRGRNLLMALVAFIGTILVLRWAKYAYMRHGPSKLQRGPGFFSRVVDVVYGLLSVMVALLAAFGVIFAAGDWLLLSLGVIFLVGVAWTMKNTLPALYEQVKLVLNLGPVRVGERFVFNGLPWEVRTLGVYSEFVNTELSGGVLRLPLRALVDEHSRPYTEKEPWFPTSANDWTILSDETYGKVVSQTPEQVVVLKLGGSRMFYQTAAFLGMNPENLSLGFRVNAVFGIDYAHQAEITTTIRDIFEQKVTEGLESCAGEEGLVSLKVEFGSAGASSLDFEILADFSGEMASRYNFLRRSIQRICVDACNENGWVIPFTQITVHQAD